MYNEGERKGRNNEIDEGRYEFRQLEGDGR